nr:hypothetical protein [Tanacetum cinerariifolium]
MAKAFKLDYSTPTSNNQRIASNLHNRHIAQPDMNMGQDKQMQMVGGNGENQFRQYAGHNVGNLNGIMMLRMSGIRLFRMQFKTQESRMLISIPWNANQIPNGNGNLVAARAEGNTNGHNGNQIRCYNCRGVGHFARNCTVRLIGVLGNANQNLNGNGNLVAARAEGNVARHNGNQIRCYNCRAVGHFARNYTVRPKRRDAAYLQTQLLIAQKEEAGIQLQAEEFDLMAAAADLDEIEEVNANGILMANLQQASTSGT